MTTRDWKPRIRRIFNFNIGRYYWAPAHPPMWVPDSDQVRARYRAAAYWCLIKNNQESLK